MKKLKLLLIPLITLALFGFKAAPAHAIDLWPFDDLWEKAKCITNINCTVRAAGVSAMNFVSYTTVGEDFDEVSIGDINKMVRGDWDQGLVAAVGRMGGLAYTFPPVDLGEYVRGELADNLLNTPVRAQETLGQGALTPIREVWSGMRNVAYGLFVIVVVVIGLMIILQKEISPRVVVTFTNALPKILLGLVLITFSYPIIALIIDVGAVFTSNLVLTAISEAFGTITADLVGGAGSIAASLSPAPAMITGVFLGGLEGLAEVQSALSSLVLLAIFAVAAVVLLGLTFIRVLIAYGYILIYTVFSPILLLFGSLPGQEGSITNFFKNVTAKTLVFPVVLFFLYLGVGLAVGTAASATERIQNVISGTYGDLAGGVFGAQGVIGGVLALIMIAAAFKAPSMVEDALDIKGMFGKK
ncbi:hypothetical protein GTO10_02005 [Candidatus Saccharibacteria bacterium]|nr:hypothetical protein [Candidatus Saccharibacteria bacterium]